MIPLKVQIAVRIYERGQSRHKLSPHMLMAVQMVLHGGHGYW